MKHIEDVRNIVNLKDLRREFGNYACRRAAANLPALSFFEWVGEGTTLRTKVVKVEVQYRGTVSVRVPLWRNTIPDDDTVERFALSCLQVTCEEKSPDADTDACVAKVEGEWGLFEVSGGPGFD